MASLTLEGIWEEVARNEKLLSGRKVRLIVLEEESSLKENEQMLTVLRKVTERSQSMAISSDSETLNTLREGRSGGMFDNDCNN